jgi:hypothetical protein
MQTYSMQKEPFIHIDGDFILWENIDFDTNLMFQNRETNFELYNDAFKKLKNKKIAENEYIDHDFINKSFNMGIFGCNDTTFSKQYAKEVFDVLKSFDYNSIEDLSYVNILLEQNYMHYLCEKLNLSFKTIHPDVEIDFTSNHKNIFFNIPSKDFPFNHFLGGSKKLESVNNYVCEALYKNHKENYKLIKDAISENYHCEYYFISKNNENYNYGSVIKNLKEKLRKFNISISNQYEKDFEDFWRDKYSFCDSINEITNTPFITSYIQVINATLFKKV